MRSSQLDSGECHGPAVLVLADCLVGHVLASTWCWLATWDGGLVRTREGALLFRSSGRLHFLATSKMHIYLTLNYPASAARTPWVLSVDQKGILPT